MNTVFDTKSVVNSVYQINLPLTLKDLFYSLEKRII